MFTKPRRILVRLENVVLLPRIGSATEVTRGQMAMVAEKNAVAMVTGEKATQYWQPEVFESPEYQRKLKP